MRCGPSNTARNKNLRYSRPPHFVETLGVIRSMRKFCGIQLLCVLTLCVLLFVSSCSTYNTGTTSGSGASSGNSTLGESMPSSSLTTPTSNSPKVTIPMQKIPDEYYRVDINKLKPIENLNANSQNNKYEDEDGTVYAFDKATGEYRGFIPPLSSTSGGDQNSIDMKKLEKAADELASHFIDVAAYELSYYYQEDTSIHKFTYCKNLKGYRTTDMGSVWITSDGNIELVMFEGTGIFNNIDLPNAIDEKALDEKFYKLLDKQIICKKIINRTLTVKEKKLYMIYDYEYEQGKEFSERNELYVNL